MNVENWNRTKSFDQQVDLKYVTKYSWSKFQLIGPISDLQVYLTGQENITETICQIENLTNIFWIING